MPEPKPRPVPHEPVQLPVMNGYVIGDDLVLAEFKTDEMEDIPDPPPAKPEKPTKPEKPQKPQESNTPKDPPKPQKPAAKIIYSGDTSKKRVAITFDDGPDPSTLKSILDILDEYNSKATFFLLGQRVKGSEHLVKEMFNRGHQIANHSYSHPQFSRLGSSEAVRQIKMTEDLLGSFMSHKYFRPPYGDYNRQTLEVAYQLGYKVMYWNVDTRDWAATNHKQIVNVVMERTKPGSIILFHEGKQLTVKALPEILKWLTDEGYTMVTLAELFNE